MKKKLALIIAACALAVSLTACGETELPDSGTAEVTTTTAEETTTTEATTTAPETTVEETTVTTVEETTVAETTSVETTVATEATTVATTVVTTATTPATTKAPTRQADYEKYGFKCLNFKSDDYLKGYKDVVITTGKDKNKSIQGKMRYAHTYPDDGAKEGYELKCINITLAFDSAELVDDYWTYGLMPDDYYDGQLQADTFTNIDDPNSNWHFKYTVNYNGVEYKDCEGVLNYGWAKGDPCTEDGKTCDTEAYLYGTFMVPKGYDGVVLALYDYTQDYTDFYKMDHKDTVFIRLL